MPKDPACVAECQRRLRDKTNEYEAIFNSAGSVYYKNTVWLNEVLASARTEFDACLSTCADFPA
jgi:hypothetical protein